MLWHGLDHTISFGAQTPTLEPDAVRSVERAKIQLQVNNTELLLLSLSALRDQSESFEFGEK